MAREPDGSASATSRNNAQFRGAARGPASATCARGLHFCATRLSILRMHVGPPRTAEPSYRGLTPLRVLGVALYGLLVWGLWYAAHSSSMARSLHGHPVGPFLAFALILGVLWAFGWGAGEPLARWMSNGPSLRTTHWTRRLTGFSIVRVLTPGLFSAAVYLLIAIPLGELSGWSLLLYFIFPSVLTVLLECLPPAAKLGWQDGVLLAALGCAVEYGWLQRSVPQPGLGSFAKLLLADVALYLYIVQRRLPGMGFDLRLRLRDLRIGVREWAIFAPIGIGLGLALGFLRFHDRLPTAGTFAATLLGTFIFVVVPEELFFRSLLQNLLETRLPRGKALALASVIFGLSHYIHGAVFNWRYVILAAVAGFFYGRAWRTDRRLAAAAVSHTLVDSVWFTWFLAH